MTALSYLGQENPKGSLGLNVKLYRSQKGLSQKNLADKLGVTVNYLSLIEGGKRYPSLKVIFKIAQALHLSPGDLLEDDPLHDELVRLSTKYDIATVLERLKKIAEQNSDHETDNSEKSTADCKHEHCTMNC